MTTVRDHVERRVSPVLDVHGRSMLLDVEYGRVVADGRPVAAGSVSAGCGADGAAARVLSAAPVSRPLADH